MPTSPPPPNPVLQVRGARASTVIVHRVPLDRVERFLEIQRGIGESMGSFAGYQATDVYPPAEREQSEWVVVIHFDGPASLQLWLDSPERAGWVEKLHAEIGEFRLKTMPTGFGAWFAGQFDAGRPPSWKIAMSVILALYPTVMTLSLVLPNPNRFGRAASMLFGNILSVCLLQWLVTPALAIAVGPWLRAKDRRTTVLGGLLIAAALAAMAIFFHHVAG